MARIGLCLLKKANRLSELRSTYPPGHTNLDNFLRTEGFEPPWELPHQVLSLTRLPFRHARLHAKEAYGRGTPKLCLISPAICGAISPRPLAYKGQPWAGPSNIKPFRPRNGFQHYSNPSRCPFPHPILPRSPPDRAQRKIPVLGGHHAPGYGARRWDKGGKQAFLSG